ncbi:PAS domain S-box protein [Thiorhodovibrio winogradskyi]|uniref:PAS domain S-box protein n=1 Tax=Thiorhodovibrio winogradskyi TaxID=77007 RepID=UPI001913D209|nr:PAS domain S-box protein [Thiorhodovibrio winogradskyi]MBK5969963.1 hypothetical protein [Thiorhodovibrio winogradskyi]
MSRTTNDAQHPETPLAPAAASASAPASSLDLRARAEARLVARGKLPSEPLTRETSQQLIHELSVHQIELEIQNEELRRSQSELEASQARYFELYDLAPVGYVALNDGGLIKEANLAAARLLDLPRRDLINKRLSNWIKPDDQDIFYLCRRRLKATAPQQQCELRLQRPDGSSLWAALALSLQPGRESEPQCLVVLNDIDVHKQLDALRSQTEQDMLSLNAELEQRVQTRTAELEQATAALQKTEERFRYAMDATQDGIWDWQMAKDSVYYSPGYARMLGYQPGELTPNKGAWLQLLFSGERESIATNLSHQLPSGTLSLEYRLRTKTGGYRWVLGRGKVVERDADGTPIRVVGTHVDITERKTAELILRSYRQIVETASDMLIFLDRELRYQIVNPAYATCHGSTPEQLHGQPLEAVEDAEVFAQVHPHLQAGLAGKIRKFAVRCKNTDGQPRWIDAEQRPFFQRGKVVGLVVSFHDITEIHEARIALEAERAHLEAEVTARTAELRMQTERLTLATEAGGVGIWTWNPDSGTITWDTQVRELYGLSSQDATPSVETWKRWVRREDFPRLMVSVRRVLNGKRQIFYHVFRIRARNGQERYIAARGRLLPPTAEGERLMLGVNWNVTDEQRTAAALRVSEANANAVVNASPVPLAITHKSDGVCHLNPAFVATFGYDLDEIPTWSHWWSRAVPEPAERARTLSMLQQQLTTITQANNPSDPLEIKVRRRDGREAVVVIRVTQMGHDKQLNTLYDITELVQARVAAQQAARAKSDFLSHMSHEIRTPLNAALGMTEVLERTHLDAEQLHLVRQVRMAGRSLLEILNDILDISRIEAGAMQIEQRAFALPSVLNSLEALLSSAAHQKKIRLAISTPPAIDGALLGDARRLKQVLINLVGNAIKFTKHGEVWVEITRLEETTEEIGLRFEVVDTGIGIPPEMLELLFQAFVQGSVGVTRRFGGTGLGLAICKHLVEAMGGTIGAESLPGIGSLFWVDLTFGRTTETPEQPETLEPSASPFTGEPRLDGARMLLVDDSAMNREVGERLLMLEGAHITLASDGRKALELLREYPRDFDAVLMDIQMPNMDGITATRRIRGELGLTDLPIVALTAGVLPAQQAAALEAGMNAVLIKPLETDRMVATLRQCMGLEPASGSRAPPPSTKVAEPFPEIPGIDPVQVNQITGGSPALFENLLSLFVADAPSSLTKTREALKVNDRMLASRLMHSLRGNASILGAPGIMDAAKALQDSIDAGESDLDGPLDALATQLAPLIAASNAWHPTQPATETQAKAASQKASEPPHDEVEALHALRAILRINDLDAIAHFDRLRPELNNILGETRSEALGREISNLRFNEALALLEPAIAEQGPVGPHSADA